MKYRTGLGQDSHRFLDPDSTKPCIIGGVIFEEVPGLAADSDGDVIFHAICNAITSITGKPILATIASDLCHKDGITDSRVYLEKAVDSMDNQKIIHVAISLEGKRPRFQSKINAMREKVADILKIDIQDVGITATSGDGLTDFGCGDGIQCLCILTSVDVF